MRKFMPISLIAALLVWFLSAGASAIPTAGGTEGIYSEWGLGLKAITMGKAFVGLADDASALAWNPAGLGLLKKTEISAMFTKPFSDVSGISYQSIVMAKPLTYSLGNVPNLTSTLGTLAFGVAYSRVGDLQERDSGGALGPTFTNTDLIATFGYSKNIGKKSAVGLAFKVENFRLYDYSDSAFGFDLGFITQLVSYLKVGFKLENIHQPQITLEKESDTRPFTTWLGGSFNLKGYVVLSLATSVQLSGKTTGHIGVEIKPHPMLSILGGYSSDSKEVTTGVGFEYKIVRLGYGFGLTKYLGNTHRVELGFLL
jgi:hypothetical protein